MPILAIDIHDAGIRAARSGVDEPLLVDGESRSSPGVAIIGTGSVVTGVEAARRARIHPSATRDRFWERLDRQPVDAQSPRAGNQAELACAHLRSVANSVRSHADEGVFGVPADYTREQLGVLVAIAREAGIRLSGLVPRPIAFDAPVAHGGSYLFVDIALHRSVLSIVDARAEGGSGPCLVVAESKVCPDVGIDALRRRWVKAIGGEFLRTTRFDPLHDAASEQQLHGIVQALADGLGAADAEPIELRTAGRSYQIMATSQLLADSTQDLIRTLATSVRSAVGSGSVGEIVIGGGAGRVPGLEDALVHQTAIPIHWLEPGAAALGLARLWPERFERTGEPGVSHHTWRRVGAEAGSAR